MEVYRRPAGARAVPHVGIRRALGSVGVAGALLVGLAPSASAVPTPVVSIGDVTVAEGTGGTVNASFTIQASPPPKQCCALQVSWSTAPATAVAPADYVTSSGTVSLSKSASVRMITVPVAGDAMDEAAETFVVNLSGLVGSPGTIGDAQGVATITDDDAPPSLSIDDVSVAEGDAGTTTASFTLSLSATSGLAVSVNWATADGTASAGGDYVSGSGSRTIPAGSSTATVDVTVNGDAVDEPDETFGVTLSGPVNASFGDDSGVATILDDDPQPTLAIGDASVTESNAGTTTAVFPVTLAPASGRTVTVDWATADDEAVQPADYASASGTLTFLPGETSGSVSVSVNGDLTAELDEVFRVTLSAPTNATVGDGLAVGTIEDDELLPVIDVDDPIGPEGSSGTTSMTFTVSVSNAAGMPVSVEWTTGGGTATAGTDYAAASGTVTFAPLDTSETVTIDVSGDVAYEHDETVVITLSNSTNAPIGDATGIGTSTNDDPAPTLTVADVSVAEGNAGTSTLTYSVTLLGASEVDAAVDFATADATATAGDYVSTSGTLTIPAGAGTGGVDVTVNGDTAFEGDERLTLSLSDPTAASLGDASATGTIVNDDVAVTTITVKVVKKSKTVSATGLLEPTKRGHRVTVTLLRKQGGRYVKVAAKAVKVKLVQDRDADGQKDGRYLASFARPFAGGAYKFVASFKGTPSYLPCTRSKRFSLAAR